MAELINLRQARKRRARAEREREAAENRRRFGQSKAERTHNEGERTLADRRLDGHRRDAPETAERDDG